MRDLLTGLAIVVILALSAAMAAPWFVNWNAWRPQIEERLTTALGRDVHISGDIAITLLPQPRFVARGVSVAGAQAPASLTADTVEIELGLTALATGQLRITDGLVEKPVLVWREAGVLPSAVSPPAPDHARPFSIERLSLRGGELLVLASNGRPQFSARGDLDIEAASIAGPWKAQGRADLGGKMYDVRWSSGVMSEDGKAAVKFGVQAAGLAFILDADGSLLVDRQAWRTPPRFEGRLSASGVAPWPFGKGAGPQPWRVVANGTADFKQFIARDLDIEAGPQDAGIKAEGDGTLSFSGLMSARAAIKARTLDLDKMTAVDPGQDAPALPMENAAETEKLLAAIPFPISLEATVERAYARGESFGPVNVVAQLDQGAIAVDRADAQMPGGVKATASGRAWIDSEPAFEASISLSSSAPAKAWSWVSGAPLESVKNPRFARAANASASGRLRWRPGRIAIDDATIALDGAQARISAQRRFASEGDPGRIGLDIRADKFDLDLMPPLNALTAADGPDVNLTIAAKDVMSQTLGVSLGALDVDAKQQSGVLTVSKLSLRQTGFSLTGDGVVKNGVGRVTAELVADNLQPLASALQRALPGKASDALASRAALLSPARLSASVQPSRDGKTWLARIVGAAGETRIDALAEARAGAEGQAAVNVESLRVNAEAADAGRLIRLLGRDAAPSTQPGSFALAIMGSADKATSFTLNAAIAGASIEASGQASDAMTQAVAGRVRLNAGDIGPALKLLGLPAAATPQPAWLESPLEIGAGGLSLPQLAGAVGGKRISSAALQISLSDEPRATGRIEFSDLSLAELSGLVLGVDPSAATTGFWSSTRFPSFAGWPAPFDLDIRAPRLALGAGWSAANASLRLVSRNDGLRLESASADFAGGQITANGAIRRDGGLAAVTGRLDLRNVDLTTLGASGGFAGKADLALDLAGNGDALSRVVANLGGAGSATLRGATLPRLDVAAPSRVSALQAKREGLPSLDAVTPLVEQEMARAPLVIDTLSAPLTVANGAMRFGPARAETTSAIVTGSAQIDLRSLTLDARGVVGARAQDAAQTPEIGVAYSGPLAAPRRMLDVSALFGDLTQKAAAREAERIDTLEQDARERAAFNRRLRAERQRVEAERQRVEAERAEAERQRVEAEKQRVAAERAERQRVEAERQKLEAERLEALQRAERQRFEAERLAAQQRAERMRQLEVERLAAQRAEAERQRLEAERLAAPPPAVVPPAAPAPAP
ncbi:AsmA-like C-terminal region-containing protein [Terrarubrum flagellatum]|uniref:AsmA family protein n=1 Tax=Terrirubrum flagellatum TaxID=2895980 RepID=UPI003144DC5F